MIRNITVLSMFLLLTSCGDKIENNYQQTVAELEALKMGREASEGNVEYNASTYIENPNFLIQLGKEPDRGSVDYYSLVESMSESGKKIVKISGLNIRVGNGSRTDIKVSENIDLIEINAEELIIEKAMMLPGANVVINAKRLIFTNDGLISIRPKKISTGAPLANDGQKGISAGSITLNVNSLEIGEGKIRFDISGGDGQDAGHGIPGRSGKDVVPYHGTVVSICTTIQKRCRDTLGIIAHPNSGASCVTNIPENGHAGTMAGAPGAGGNGGTLNYSDYQSIESFIMYDPGLQGAPAPITIGGVGGTPRVYHREHRVKEEITSGGGCSGGRRGRPELFNRNFVVPLSQSVVLLGKTLNGDNIESPQIATSTSERGILTYYSSKRMSYVSRLLALKLSYAKDLYRNNYFEKALAELEELAKSYTIRNEVYSEIILTEAHQLINQLRSHKDIDGLSVNHVPLLSLPKILAAYKKEIDTAFDTLKFVSYFSNKIVSVEEKRDRILERQDLLRDEVEHFKEQNKKANLGLTDAIKVSYEIESSEQAFTEALRAVEAEIEEEARRNIHDRESKKKLLGTVKFISNLAKVFPAGQPAIGAIAMGLDSVMAMSENESWVDNVKDGYDVYSELRNGLSSEKWAKSKKSWNENYSDLFYDKFKNNNPDITNKKFEKYLKNLTEANKPLVKEVSNYYKNVISKQVPQNEYQLEIKKIKQNHPRFNMVISKLEELQSKKEKFDNLINQNMAIISMSQSSIYNNFIAISSAQTQNEELIDGLNFDTNDTIKLFEKRAKERLREYKKLLIKAYNFRLITSYKGSYDIEKIEEQLYKFSKSNNDTIDIDLVKDLYRFDVAEISQGIFEAVNGGDLVEYETSITYELNQKELSALTNGVAIFFNPKNKELLHRNEENLRVESIIVDELDAKLYNNDKSLDVTLSQTGPMEIERFGKNYIFGNDENDNVTQWKTRYDPYTQRLTEVKESMSLNNLFDVIYGSDARGEVDLYMKPALRANYIIKVSDNLKELKRLRFTIQYTYSIKK